MNRRWTDIIVILVLETGSILDRPNLASSVHSVPCLGFAVVNSTSFKVFFRTLHISYRVWSYLPCTVWICECWFSSRVQFICSKYVSQPPKPCSLIFFDVLLTVHLSIFISVFNQLDVQKLFYNKFYFMPLHVSSTSAHHQEVKIALHSLG